MSCAMRGGYVGSITHDLESQSPNFQWWSVSVNIDTFLQCSHVRLLASLRIVKPWQDGQAGTIDVPMVPVVARIGVCEVVFIPVIRWSRDWLTDQPFLCTVSHGHFK